MRVANIDHEVNLPAVDEGANVGLHLAQRLLQQLDLKPVTLEEVVRALRAVDGESECEEIARRIEELHLGREGADAEEDGRLGQLEGSGEHRSEDCVVLVLTKGGHLGGGVGGGGGESGGWG